MYSCSQPPTHFERGGGDYYDLMLFSLWIFPFSLFPSKKSLFLFV